MLDRRWTLVTDLNLPYEPVGDDPIEMSLGSVLAGGMTYRSAILADPDDPTAKLPVLIWDFWAADGRKLAPIALVIPAEQLLALPDQIRKAVRDAMRAASA